MDKKNAGLVAVATIGPSLKLPSISNLTGSMLDQLTAALAVDRGVVAYDHQIEHASNYRASSGVFPPSYEARRL